MSDKCVVCFSGGQDSTTCALWATRRFDELYLLTFTYAQKHESEVRWARKIRRDIPKVVSHDIIELLVLSLSKSALTDHTISTQAKDPETGLPATYFPGLNLLFLSVATT